MMFSRAITRAKYGTPALLSIQCQPKTLRHYSAPVAGNASAALPLAGYRVLDLTRVLAGVSLVATPSHLIYV